MLHSLKNLKKCSVLAADGEIGKVRDAFFDDEDWVVRYLVVDTGNWLSRHEVLLSPSSVTGVDWQHARLHTDLTREHIENAPPVTSHEPVTRRAEASMAEHFGLPYYWSRGGGKPFFSRHQQEVIEGDIEANPEDSHLQSCNDVAGFAIAADGERQGHVADYLFDEDGWTLQYLVIDPRDLWPGEHVLAPVSRIGEVGWADRSVAVDMTAGEVRNATPYDPHHLPPPSRSAIRNSVDSPADRPVGSPIGSPLDGSVRGPMDSRPAGDVPRQPGM